MNAELLSRFVPQVAADTFAAFARHQREDGLFPYKLTQDGPAFSQIQTVTPLARSVWTHYAGTGRDRAWLKRLYDAMARNDAWLARWRDTRGTGGVEAFCTYDTGHDLSARFWHIPDSPAGNDPKRYRTDNSLLPLVAPDLTANVACQRQYLALMAGELGEDATVWQARAAASEEALFAQCFDAEDHFFYDRDPHGRLLRVQSDVLLRVLACEIGDEAFFATALERYLLNTGKFFAKYPFTSLALDDPRFDPAFDYNSWCGPTNFLSLIRAPHAFEQHGRHVELTWMMQPILSALFRASRFAQTLNPFTGEAGFTEVYSPSILCLLDFVERLSGILPRADETLWFTALVPIQIDHRDKAHATGYRRAVDGQRFEWINDGETAHAFGGAEWLFSVPNGVRVTTDRQGQIRSLTGMSATTMTGTLETPAASVPLSLSPNEVLALTATGLKRARPSRLTLPTF
ncbi:MGH1-like glycoside hydrolase domain-containing protein [Devosia oryzisoli]